MCLPSTKSHHQVAIELHFMVCDKTLPCSYMWQPLDLFMHTTIRLKQVFDSYQKRKKLIFHHIWCGGVVATAIIHCTYVHFMQISLSLVRFKPKELFYMYNFDVRTRRRRRKNDNTNKQERRKRARREKKAARMRQQQQ